MWAATRSPPRFVHIAARPRKRAPRRPFQWQVAPARFAVLWSMQNVSAALPDPNVQHWSYCGSVQSAFTWQIVTL